MTTTRERIIAGTEAVFDEHGFAGVGMDRLTEASGVSSRTLYKHMGSKTGLIAAVLDARRERFDQAFDVLTIEDLFATLASWADTEGARGCLFLRALGEDGRSAPEVDRAVSDYRDLLQRAMARIVEHETGRTDAVLAEQLLVLFEGATAAMSYRGRQAIDAAHAAAKSLIGGLMGATPS
ncbi:TetR/AcrR family transcriptional regulator [Prauserella alba]|uniref:TetR/AcrR family transcriptional regulator n=1 Tax=Prauserella alba TaxID=176898 RepID=A0ABN1V4E9_9PSEU|nr:TetR/AcrR family transcriptional regulator [Prauserella alba]MCP2180155.1 transcriptional regulator, TetR family [Prauserella alba]